MFPPLGPFGGPLDESGAIPLVELPHGEPEAAAAEEPGADVEEPRGELEAPDALSAIFLGLDPNGEFTAPEPFFAAGMFWELAPNGEPVVPEAFFAAGMFRGPEPNGEPARPVSVLAVGMFCGLDPNGDPNKPEPFFAAGMFIFPTAGLVGSRREKSTSTSRNGDDEVLETGPGRLEAEAGEKERDTSLWKASFRWLVGAVAPFRGDQPFCLVDCCFKLFFNALFASGCAVCCLAKPLPGVGGFDMPIGIDIGDLLFPPPKTDNKSVKNFCGLHVSVSFDMVCFLIVPMLFVEPGVRFPITFAFPSPR